MISKTWTFSIACLLSSPSLREFIAFQRAHNGLPGQHHSHWRETQFQSLWRFIPVCFPVSCSPSCRSNCALHSCVLVGGKQRVGITKLAVAQWSAVVSLSHDSFSLKVCLPMFSQFPTYLYTHTDDMLPNCHCSRLGQIKRQFQKWIHKGQQARANSKWHFSLLIGPIVKEV